LPLPPLLLPRAFRAGHPARPITGWPLSELIQPSSLISELKKFEPDTVHRGLVVKPVGLLTHLIKKIQFFFQSQKKLN